MFEKFNKNVKTIREGVNTDDMEFVKLEEFIGQTVKVDGFFFTEGNYGEQVVVVGNGYLINMPTRCVEDFHEIEGEEKMLYAVLNGHLALTNIREKQAKAGMTTIFDYTDI